MSFLPAMIMRSGPDALVGVWSDESLSAALITKRTAQTVYGLLVDANVELLESLEAYLASRAQS